MLVLARREGEGIHFLLPDGTPAWLVVTEVLHHVVRFGLQFPKDVAISRHELLTPELRATAPVPLTVD